MLFNAGSSPRPLPLKPVLWRIREGYLLGLALDPGDGSPCANCVELWLKDRNVFAERAELSELRVRRDLIGELLAENSGHVFHEITNDGLATRLDCLVFPHPACSCDKTKYVAPREVTKKTNFAFSPIMQLKCARFGTPEGNLWLTSATGDSPFAKERVVTYGVSRAKETSRWIAVEEWMKKSAVLDGAVRGTGGEPQKAEILQTGARQIIPAGAAGLAICGAGVTEAQAVHSALMQWARQRTLGKYSTTMKSPMLIVGANNWIRLRVPFFLLQNYDLHLLFYPNAMPAWVVGIAAFSRVRTDERPQFVFGSAAKIGEALEMAIGKILETCHPREEGAAEPVFRSAGEKRDTQVAKLNLWWTHWIYRCPKIALKDVVHLEDYPTDIEHWREFLRDGEAPVGVSQMNSPWLPASVRTLVRLYLPQEASARVSRNVNGIGTFAAFQDSLQ